ncbi:NUDIX domain-containing protein [candidate division WWE3 bacterium]|uniref:NUDIX domain-containing protein n=1 Tax=candidate division WWE3 bacterium TaxID=2053526 RepID=A0A955LKR3_UNCKA|nr:NUDIX domain-containing protein [candidate division WWE3 bacterium]
MSNKPGEPTTHPGPAETAFDKLRAQDETLRLDRHELDHLRRLAGIPPQISPAEELYLAGIRNDTPQYTPEELAQIASEYEQLVSDTRIVFNIVFLIDKKGQVMALIRSNLGKGKHLDNTINGVGGKFDANLDKSIAQSAIRETREETGLVLDEESLAPLALLHNDEEQSWLCYFVGLVDDLDQIAEHEDREGKILVGDRRDLANQLAGVMIQEDAPQMALNPASRLIGFVPEFLPSKDNASWPPENHPLLVGRLNSGMEPPKFVNPDRWSEKNPSYEDLYRSLISAIEENQLAKSSGG